jgi:hypothetical protein
MGFYLPWTLIGGIVTTVGNGLVSMFTASTSIATYIGMQIVVGAGRGSGMQNVRVHSSHQFLEASTDDLRP